jgi:hypothetical protein
MEQGSFSILFKSLVGPLRLSVYGGGLLTLVAFKYGVMDHLPSVPYPTFTDNFLPLGPLDDARWKSHGRGTPVLLDLLRLILLHFHWSRVPLIVHLFLGTAGYQS